MLKGAVGPSRAPWSALRPPRLLGGPHQTSRRYSPARHHLGGRQASLPTPLFPRRPELGRPHLIQNCLRGPPLMALTPMLCAKRLRARWHPQTARWRSLLHLPPQPMLCSGLELIRAALTRYALETG